MTTTSMRALPTPIGLLPKHRYTPPSAAVMEGITRVEMSVLSEWDYGQKGETVGGSLKQWLDSHPPGPHGEGSAKEPLRG